MKRCLVSALGCLPWPLSLGSENYCSQTENMTAPVLAQYMRILHRLDNYLPTNTCQHPCSVTDYHSYLVKSEASTNRVIQLIFPQTILVRETQPQYTFLPILTTVGGMWGSAGPSSGSS